MTGTGRDGERGRVVAETRAAGPRAHLSSATAQFRGASVVGRRSPAATDRASSVTARPTFVSGAKVSVTAAVRTVDPLCPL